VAGFVPRPMLRPLTRFENRGLKLGHEVPGLVFEPFGEPSIGSGM
jgi:hypothetical protein